MNESETRFHVCEVCFLPLKFVEHETVHDANLGQVLRAAVLQHVEPAHQARFRAERWDVGLPRRVTG
jgi:hypothetical protein